MPLKSSAFLPRMQRVLNQANLLPFFFGILVFACTFILWLPGVPFGHDFSYHFSRIHSLADGMRHGQLFLKVYPDLYNGYGYPCGLFYGDLFLYLPAFLNFCGLDLLLCYKLFLTAIVFAAACTSYTAAACIYNSRCAGCFCAALYTGSAYFIFNLYLRAALGEAQAVVFFPLVLLGLYELLYREQPHLWPLVTGFGGLLVSHILGFVLAIAFASLLLVLHSRLLLRRPQRLLYLCKAAGLTLLLTAYFLFPMLEQMAAYPLYSYANNNVGSMAQNAVRIRDLFVNLSGSQLMSPGVLLPGIGIGFLLVYFAGAAALITNNMPLFALPCLCIGTLTLFCSTSLFPWAAATPYLQFLQFPWRLLFPAAAFLALAGGGLAHRLLADRPKTRAAVLAVVVVVSCCTVLQQSRSIYLASATQPSLETRYQIAQSVEDGGMLYFTLEQCKFVDNLYLHANHPSDFFQPVSDQELSVQSTVPYRLTRTYNSLTVFPSDPQRQTGPLLLPLNYVYGYSAVDEQGNRFSLSASDNGLLQATINTPIQGSLTVCYTGTLLQKITLAASVITATFLMVCFVRKKLVLNFYSTDSSF